MTHITGALPSHVKCAVERIWNAVSELNTVPECLILSPEADRQLWEILSRLEELKLTILDTDHRRETDG